jgi:hypothetical protein
MNAYMKWLLPALVVSLPVAAFAQSADTKYCSDLSDKYSRYLDMSSKKGAQPQSLDAKASVGKCQAGDIAASIPVLEKALKDAKLDLPPRT